jgi:hypothetical protein
MNKESEHTQKQYERLEERDWKANQAPLKLKEEGRLMRTKPKISS